MKTICSFFWSDKSIDWRRQSVQLRLLIKEVILFICLISWNNWLMKTFFSFVWSAETTDWWRQSIHGLVSWDHWLKESICSFIWSVEAQATDWRRPSIHCLVSWDHWLKESICSFVWSAETTDWWRLSVHLSKCNFHGFAFLSKVNHGIRNPFSTLPECFPLPPPPHPSTHRT